MNRIFILLFLSLVGFTESIQLSNPFSSLSLLKRKPKLTIYIGDSELKVDPLKYSLKWSEKNGLVSMGDLVGFFNQLFLDLNREGIFLQGPMFMQLQYQKYNGTNCITVDPTNPAIYLSVFKDLFSNSLNIPQLTTNEIAELRTQLDKLCSAIPILDFDSVDEVFKWYTEKATEIQKALVVYYLTILKMSFRHSQAPKISAKVLEKLGLDIEEYRAISVPVIDTSGISFGIGKIILIPDTKKHVFAKLIHAISEFFYSDQTPEERTKLLGFHSDDSDSSSLVLPYTSTPLNAENHNLSGSCVEVFYAKDSKLSRVTVQFREIFPIQSHSELKGKSSTQDEILSELPKTQTQT